MREIKFRAWDKQGKEMFRVYTMYFIEGKNTMACGKGGCAPVDDDTVLMQYTGLHDRNGKEIYEGDIVKQAVSSNKELHGEYTFKEVVYRSGMWCIEYLRSEKETSIPRGYMAGDINDAREDADKEMYFTDIPNINDLEVVGNIYEHPHLLTTDWVDPIN